MIAHAGPLAPSSIFPGGRTEKGAVARMFCDILKPGRHALRGRPALRAEAQPQEGRRAGLHLLRRPGAGVLLLQERPRTRETLDEGGYFDLTPLDVGSDLRRDTVLALEADGHPVEYSHHEVAPSQHEIDLRYADALTMADSAMTYRLVVKEIAQKHGVYATFMPKPIFGQNGSGMHVHQSLFKGEQQRLLRRRRTSTTSRRSRKAYIAGLLKHARRSPPVTNQWVNSYKRLVPGLRGAGLHRLGAAEPLRPGPRARCTSPARRRRPASSSAARTRPATRTSPSP